MSDPPPQVNPVLNAYENFIRETPLVTRYVITSQAVTWIITFMVDLSKALANTPYFTVYYFEIYRILLSPFVCPGFISLVFAYLSFTENGRRLEFSMGSASFATLLLSIGIVTNTLYLVLSFALYFITGSLLWLFAPSIGIWIILFGIIAIECSEAPQSSMRKLFFFTVPTIYYPLALFGLFSLLGGFQLSYLLSIGVGYAYGKGYLDQLKISDSRFKQWESSFLEQLTNMEGWVVASAAIGSGAWSDTDINSPRGESTGAGGSGGMGFFSQLTGAQQQQPQQYSQHEQINPPDGVGGGGGGGGRAGEAVGFSGGNTASFPSSGGRQLGTATRRPATDPRQARLQAIEKRSGQEEV